MDAGALCLFSSRSFRVPVSFFIFLVCSATTLSYLLTLFISPSSSSQKSSSPGTAVFSLSWWYTSAPHSAVVFSNLVTLLFLWPTTSSGSESHAPTPPRHGHWLQRWAHLPMGAWGSGVLRAPCEHSLVRLGHQEEQASAHWRWDLKITYFFSDETIFWVLSVFVKIQTLSDVFA